MKIYYDKKLKKLSRSLRKGNILAEVILWKEIRGRKIYGCQFTRQKPISRFIVDFYCSKLNLVIEIDGESHSEKIQKDIERQKFLESLGLTVLRFEDVAVLQDTSGVLEILSNWIRQKIKKQPSNPLC